MRGVNRITLVGNLGDIPELRSLENNLKVARCKMATTEVFKNRSGETSASTQWHTVLFYNSLAELAASYLQKGHLIYVEGKIRYRTYQNKEAITCYVTEILAESFIMLNKPEK